MTEQSKPPVVVKKYANRRLYNTATSSYVTLDHLCEMVKQSKEFVVRDAKTGEVDWAYLAGLSDDALSDLDEIEGDGTAKDGQ